VGYSNKTGISIIKCHLENHRKMEYEKSQTTYWTFALLDYL
ncbi:1634_t:CDS:1, partial [Ambispora gerdemannii]